MCIRLIACHVEGTIAGFVRAREGDYGHIGTRRRKKDHLEIAFFAEAVRHVWLKAHRLVVLQYKKSGWHACE